MTHEEKMRKMEMDHQARMAELRAERAKILAERAEIHRKGEERRAAVDRIEEENEIRFEKIRAAIAANDFDEVWRINEELTDSLIKVRQILGIR